MISYCDMDDYEIQLYDYKEGDTCPLCHNGTLVEFETGGDYGEYRIKCDNCGCYEEYDRMDCFTGNCQR